MPHAPPARLQKMLTPVLRSVEELVRHQEFSWAQVFFQRSDSTYRDEAFHPQKLHRVDVRSEIDLARQKAMPAPVPRTKCDPLSFQSSHYNRTRRVSKGRF